jgi:adenosine deaminase
MQVIHTVINSIVRVRRITREAIEDFRADGVVYVELRSTPRSLPDGSTKRDYVRGIIDEIDECNSSTIARVILSIDRTKSVDDAIETVNLALEFPEVVGIDFRYDICADVTCLETV